MPGRKKQTTADKKGNWMIKLGKLKANASPATLSVQGKNLIQLENVLVGEVWICSGQSNMEWRVSQCQPQGGNRKIELPQDSTLRRRSRSHRSPNSPTRRQRRMESLLSAERRVLQRHRLLLRSPPAPEPRDSRRIDRIQLGRNQNRTLDHPGRL